jgi:hypothetical protein
VAKAFGVPIDSDPRALAILHEWVKTTGAEMNEAPLRMTRMLSETLRADAREGDIGVRARISSSTGCRGRLASGSASNRDGGRALDHAGDAR